MKKLLFLFCLCITIICGAQNLESISHNYLYHGFKVYDRDNNLIKASSSGDPIGLFIVAEISGEKFLSVTVGDESVYAFKVVLSKNVDDNDGTHTDVYAGGMTIEGQIVPLQVLVCYSKSIIPDVILVDVFNSPTLIELNSLVPLNYQLQK